MFAKVQNLFTRAAKAVRNLVSRAASAVREFFSRLVREDETFDVDADDVAASAAAKAAAASVDATADAVVADIVGDIVADLAAQAAAFRDIGRASPAPAPAPALDPCTACGDESGDCRLGLGNAQGLCRNCFDLLCEEDAIRVSGVSLQARKCLVLLNEQGIRETKEAVGSASDPAQIYWAETGWWRDASGAHHARRWTAFVAGEPLADVTDNFNPKRGHDYVVTAFGLKVASCRGWHEARFVAADEIRRHEDAVQAALAAAKAVAS